MTICNAVVRGILDFSTLHTNFMTMKLYHIYSRFYAPFSDTIIIKIRFYHAEFDKYKSFGSHKKMQNF